MVTKVIGGLLSVSRNLDSYNVEIKLKKTVWASLKDKYLVAVLVRFTVSILGAVALYVFLECKFLTMTAFETNRFIIYGLALIAGFSENLIPSLITKFETNIVKGEPIPMRVNEPLKPSTFTGNNTSPLATPPTPKPPVTPPATPPATTTNTALDGSDEEQGFG